MEKEFGDLEFTVIHQGLGVTPPTVAPQEISPKVISEESRKQTPARSKWVGGITSLSSAVFDNLVILGSFALFLILLHLTLESKDSVFLSVQSLNNLSEKPLFLILIGALLLVLFITYFLFFRWIESPTLGEMIFGQRNRHATLKK